MKESIDLTENRAFRDDPFQREMNSINKDLRFYKRTPWERVGSDEPARLRSKIDVVTGKYESSLTWTRHNPIIGSTSNIIGLNNFSMSSTLSLNWTDGTGNSQLVDNVYYYDNTGYKISYSNDGSINIQTKEPMELMSEFPMGRRDTIKARRLPIQKKKYPARKICRCGNLISKTPWSDKHYCEKCVSKMRSFNKKGNSEILNTFKNSISVPCLSSDIPEIERKKKYPKRYKEWGDYDDEFIKDYVYDLFDVTRKRRRAKYVYYKNRPLGRREEPWQPNGRVPQDYDEMFESTDWKDMLKKRIGTLEREHIFGSQEEAKLNDSDEVLITETNTISINNNSWITIGI